MIEALNDIPLAGLMLVVALGFTLGRLAWRGLSLGPAGGTVVVALIFGSLGLSFGELYGTDDPTVTLGALGFALFIYSVGFEAGPRFFGSLLGGPGWRFVVVGTVVNVLAVALALACGKLLGLGESITAGMLAGALTSAPTYAAAAEVCDDRTALAVSFALTYPIGLAGVVLLIQFLPRLTGENLAAGTVDPVDEADESTRQPASPELTRVFEVHEEGVVDKTLRDLDFTHRTGCYLTSVRRGEDILVPDAETRLERGDHVMVRGRFDELQVFMALVGPEVYDDELRRRMPAPRRVHVTAGAAVGKTLKDIDLGRRHQCLVTAIQRGDVVLEPWPELGLERDDVLDVVGPRDCVRAVSEELGRFERPTDETDIAVYAGGIFLGVLVGHFTVVGFAGGLLLAGVLLGRFRRIGPLHAHVPQAARQLVRDLGILLFVAEAGVKAGGSSVGAMHGMLGATLAAAAFVTLLPVMGALLAARKLMRMRPVDAWGSVGGGMTSSAALVAIRRAADSNEPALSYAASYAVASVLVTIAGAVVVYLM